MATQSGSPVIVHCTNHLTRAEAHQHWDALLRDVLWPRVRHSPMAIPGLDPDARSRDNAGQGEGNASCES